MTEPFSSVLRADLVAYGVAPEKTASTLRLVWHTFVKAVFHNGFACVLLFRLNVLIRGAGILANLLHQWRFYRFGNDISFYAEIGPGFKIAHTSDIVIGKEAVIGRRCTVYNGVTIGAKRFDAPHEKPHIGDDVIIGTGAKVLGNIAVGNHAMIGALTLCTVSVPDGALAIGNPVHIKEHYRS